MTAAVTFAAVLPALLVAHHVADHWVQTDTQAGAKGADGREGQAACLRHVITYTITLAFAVGIVAWRLHLDIDTTRTVAALALNGVTHYWADRRTGLLALAHRLGKSAWLQKDPEAPYKLDQSWHVGWLLVTALLIT